MIPNLVRERRTRQGLSQVKLARLAECSESILSDVELGKRQAWPKLRAALARVLGIPEEELFPKVSQDEALGRASRL